MTLIRLNDNAIHGIKKMIDYYGSVQGCLQYYELTIPQDEESRNIYEAIVEVQNTILQKRREEKYVP